MGLDQLAARPNSPVLVVEGEKKVEAVRTLLGGFVGVCWAGGAQGVRHTDWTPLHGRSVTCWPDADEPGALAMDEVARILTELNRAEAA
jgi:DNA primase